jgi:hypothetical protein
MPNCGIPSDVISVLSTRVEQDFERELANYRQRETMDSFLDEDAREDGMQTCLQYENDVFSHSIKIPDYVVDPLTEEFFYRELHVSYFFITVHLLITLAYATASHKGVHHSATCREITINMN